MLTGCASAQAAQPRERVVLDAREATYAPPIEGETPSGDFSDASDETPTDTAQWGEAGLETDESAVCGDSGWSYEAACYAPSYVEGETDFRTQGVVYDDGTRYTWYGQGVLPGGGLDELNGNGRTVNEQGFVTDGEGRIAVASSDHEIGTVLDTPFGEAVVYDTGCPSGTVDVYTDWS